MHNAAMPTVVKQIGKILQEDSAADDVKMRDEISHELHEGFLFFFGFRVCGKNIQDREHEEQHGSTERCY